MQNRETSEAFIWFLQYCRILIKNNYFATYKCIKTTEHMLFGIIINLFVILSYFRYVF